MNGRDLRAQWIAFLLLAPATTCVLWIWASGLRTTSCRLPDDPQRLGAFADADSVTRKTESLRVSIVDWIVGGWKGAGSRRSRLRAQTMLTREHAAFVVTPLTLLPNVDLPSDFGSTGTLDTEAGPVPVHFRISDAPRTASVVAYGYAIGAEPVEWPASSLIRNALKDPWRASPPVTLFMADSRFGVIPIETRKSLVTQKLRELWRDWKAVCSE